MRSSLKEGMVSAPVPAEVPIPAEARIPAEAMAALRAVAESFALPAPVAHIEPLGNGNVNATYRVHLSSEDQGIAHGSLVLQRLNAAVFREPRLVMANIEAVASHVERRLAEGNQIGRAHV